MIAFLKHASPQTRQILKGSLIPSVLMHDVQQSFSFMYNKLQGATVDRLILVINYLSKCKLGKMCIHKLYVALSRVRKGKHLAIFQVTNKELQYLKNLRYSDKLLGWNKNYDDEGKWKTNIILYFDDVDRSFDDIYKNGGLEKANKITLVNICKKTQYFLQKQEYPQSTK